MFVYVRDALKLLSEIGRNMAICDIFRAVGKRYPGFILLPDGPWEAKLSIRQVNFGKIFLGMLTPAVENDSSIQFVN